MLELANEEVCLQSMSISGPNKKYFREISNQIFVTNTTHQVIGAMKSSLPGDVLQAVPNILGLPPPFVPKDRIFHVKVCKLHWRGDSNVSGVINIITLLISIFLFILRRDFAFSPCTTSNPQWGWYDEAS